MFNHKWKSLITKGNTALRRRCNSDARDLYCQSITESDRLLKLFRTRSGEMIKTLDDCIAVVSMLVVSHHNMADLWERYGVRVSQTYYLEMAHQKLIDVVRDGRFPQELRSVALSELNRTYLALLSHYKTNELATEAERLVDQYSQIRQTFDLAYFADSQAGVLIH